MRFGDRFRAVLRMRGLTQEGAATLLGMRQATVSYYCNLERSPRPHIIRHMANSLGVDTSDLTGEKGRVVMQKATAKTLAAVGGAPSQSTSRALRNLKRRWKKKPNERVIIKHLIAALFGADADQIITWLDQP